MRSAAEIELEPLRYVAQAMASRLMLHNVELDQYWEYQMDHLVTALHAKVWAQEVDTAATRHPRDWWEAFKERWFPAFLLVRWPVKYAEFDVRAMRVYPEMAIPRQPSVVKFFVHERDR